MRDDVATSAAIGLLVGAFIGVLGMLCSGCLNWRGPHHPATGAEVVARDAAIDAWVAAGRADPQGVEQCGALERVEVVLVSPPPEGRSPCVYLVNGERRYGAACMSVVQPYVGAPPHLAIYLDTSLDADGQLNGISHETLHYIRGCLLGDVDHAHSDTELWDDILSTALSGR